MHAVKSYVELDFRKDYLHIYGDEMRSFDELAALHIDKVGRALGEFIKRH